ncbi:phosphotransferase family protein [Blastococcus xanthinilyticus]|uniref:Aminoglycoside phosphotransferase (APT) family kinase protein n=1 Tax=Blastococcus xanthinilyticus TaxID=1564164 RepID=A0A5S5D3F2_9ACTN|nr:phosphotransferase family protein [Blastococcus xanthinilyticus]TYP90285.1 aminoglycoside phosphotransferase (APT) family kinase protein [Blastococcus xanthinilyticus]
MSENASRLREVRPEDAFDVEAVHAWLAPRVPALAGRSAPGVRQFSGGASNLTYLLDYGDLELVLRRPPHGHKAASAHDMGREVRVQQRLRPHLDVVAEIHGFCQDPAVIGSDFYVMERLEGTILTRRLPEGVQLPPERARVLGETAYDTLADLHSIDVDAAGLADLGRGPGYVRRQVEGWSRRFRDARTDDVPAAEELMGWLAEHQPADVRASLLHGDWKLDNLVLDLSGAPRITGVLDWEMATVGDPLMDLGSSLAYWVTADDDEEFGLVSTQPSILPGMPTREQLVERYLARTGLRTDNWTFYEVFGLFRLAVIIQQIWARYSSGHSTNPRFANFGIAAAVLLQRAEKLSGCR